MKPSRVLPLALLVLVSLATRSSFGVELTTCAGAAPENRQLYFQDVVAGQACWRKPTPVGGEFTRTTTPVEVLNTLRGRDLQLAYVVYDRQVRSSAVVVKERFYKPGLIVIEPGNRPQPVPGATDRVVLERDRVQNQCGIYGKLGDNPEYPEPNAGFREYNQFHSERDAIARDNVTRLHFAYPVTSRRCRGTDDWESGNRQQFSLSGVLYDDPDFTVAGVPIRIPKFFGGSAYANVRNVTDLRLKIQNLYWMASTSDPAILRFRVQKLAGTRLELTLSDLENRLAGGQHELQKTWHLDLP